MYILYICVCAYTHARTRTHTASTKFSNPSNSVLELVWFAIVLQFLGKFQ